MSLYELLRKFHREARRKTTNSTYKKLSLFHSSLNLSGCFTIQHKAKQQELITRAFWNKNFYLLHVNYAFRLKKRQNICFKSLFNFKAF